MLDMMLQTLTEQFPDDPWAPNITFSWLPQGYIYGSIGRYSAAKHEARQVLYKTTGPDVESVLKSLCVQLGLTYE